MVTEENITDEMIRELFARHCECRPLNTARWSHSHDCYCDVLDDCQTALHAFVYNPDEPSWPISCSPEVTRAARARCSEFLNARAKGITDADIEALREQAIHEGKLTLVDFCNAALGNPPWTDWTPEFCRRHVEDVVNQRAEREATIPNTRSPSETKE